jgi:hypothetical protein
MGSEPLQFEISQERVTVYIHACAYVYVTKQDHFI